MSKKLTLLITIALLLGSGLTGHLLTMGTVLLVLLALSAVVYSFQLAFNGFRSLIGL
jgi:hypothetical protein